MPPMITRHNPTQLHNPPGYHHVTVVEAGVATLVARGRPSDEVFAAVAEEMARCVRVMHGATVSRYDAEAFVPPRLPRGPTAELPEASASIGRRQRRGESVPHRPRRPNGQLRRCSGSACRTHT